MQNNTSEIFKNKRVTVMGLGLLGGALNDIKFLAEQGAELIVTDLKSEEELKSSVEALKAYPDIEFVLGEHRLEDFKDRDFILQPGNVLADSPYLQEAKKHNIPVHVSESLFVQYAEGIQFIGVTGTRGKSTVTQLIFDVLKEQNLQGSQVFLAGNVQGVSTLALLTRIRKDDVVVAELDSWALHGMGQVQKSPHIAVFTTFMADHMDFYKGDINAYLSDKANIFRFQTDGDTLVLGEKMVKILGNTIGLNRIVSKKVIASPEDVPAEWNIKIPGEHNRYNIACGIEALRAFGLKDEAIREGVEKFQGVEGRLQLISEDDGIRVYNDTTSTTPEALMNGLRAVAMDKNVVLIAGGTDKQLDPRGIGEEVEHHTKAVVLLPGTGTEKLYPRLVGKVKELHKTESLKEAVAKAKELAQSGDVILFSPGFASFGLFKNEYHRGEEFNKLIKDL